MSVAGNVDTDSPTGSCCVMKQLLEDGVDMHAKFFSMKQRLFLFFISL